MAFAVVNELIEKFYTNHIRKVQRNSFLGISCAMSTKEDEKTKWK